MSESTHFSVDLETLGIGDQALILSVAAVEFDPLSGNILREFYLPVDYGEDGAHASGAIDLSTVLFWLKQPEKVRNRAFGNDPELPCPAPLMVVMHELGAFLQAGEGCGYRIWQRGDRDRVWIESACERSGVTFPFNWWDWRDQRTFCNEILSTDWPARSDDLRHDALEDAKYQAQCVAAAYRRLRDGAEAMRALGISADEVQP
jgi:exodeoxyribonuclease VIII